MSPRISHVIAEYSKREAMGRTVYETATRVPGTHSLIAAHVHDTADVFERAFALGGTMETFPLGRAEALTAALAEQRPDIVHVHGGALAPLLIGGSAIRNYRSVVTIYAWPRVPPVADLRSAGWQPAVESNVLRPRVLATTVLPAAVAAAALHRTGVKVVMSPDPRVLSKLASKMRTPMHRLGSGAPESDLRATWRADSPTVIFVGRAETVRGVDTLIEAFPDVLAQIPGARLRLLMLPRPELAKIEAMAAPLGEAVEVVTEASGDVLTEMAAAQVGVWPFKFDYTTSPPAMAVAEALSVGLPVVSTSVACVEAVLGDAPPGLIVPPQDSLSLGRAIVELLSDPVTWQSYADRAPGYVRDRLGWERTAETTAMAYEEALA